MPQPHQTAMENKRPGVGHPVFVAEHATATCCRGCLAKWHGIEKGRVLSAEEIDYVVGRHSPMARNAGDRPS